MKWTERGITPPQYLRYRLTDHALINGISPEEAIEVAGGRIGGNITSLPELKEGPSLSAIEKRCTILAYAYAEFAISGIEDLSFHGKLLVGNTDEENRKLFEWMDHNQIEVADYLDKTLPPVYKDMKKRIAIYRTFVESGYSYKFTSYHLNNDPQ